MSDGVLGVNLNDYEEHVILEKGSEVDFRVLDAEVRVGPNSTYYNLVLAPETDIVANPALVYEMLFIPKATDDKRIKNMKLKRIKDFCESIEYYPDDGNPKVEEMKGGTGRAILKVQEDEGYEAKNRVQRFLKVE